MKKNLMLVPPNWKPIYLVENKETEAINKIIREKYDRRYTFYLWSDGNVILGNPYGVGSELDINLNFESIDKMLMWLKIQHMDGTQERED